MAISTAYIASTYYVSPTGGIDMKGQHGGEDREAEQRSNGNNVSEKSTVKEERLACWGSLAGHPTFEE